MVWSWAPVHQWPTRQKQTKADDTTIYKMPKYYNRVLIASIRESCNGTWSSIQSSVWLYRSHKLELRSLVRTSCMDRSLNQLEAPRTWVLKSVTTLHLTINSHIQKISTSASWSLGFIKHNTYIRTKSPAIHEMAYKTLVRPLVEYSSPV